MSITDNIGTESLRNTLQATRNKLSRQTQAVKATMSLIKLLEESIQEAENGPQNAPNATRGVTKHN